MIIPWNLTRTVAPIAPVVSVQDLLAHLRIDEPALDEGVTDPQAIIGDLIAQQALLESYSRAAEETIEAELGAALLEQTWVLRLDRFPYWDIRLPRPPLLSVVSVQYIDTAGVTQTVSPTVYTVDPYSKPGRVVPAYGQVWPITLTVPNAVIITYTAGRTDATTIPEMIRMTIKLVVGDLYENRERTAIEVVRELDTYERLMANHKCYWEAQYA